MAMQQCPNGHIYDDSKNATCPYCNGDNSINVTMPLNGNVQNDGGIFPATTPIETPQPEVRDFPVTAPVQAAFGVTEYVGSNINSKGIVEVRGWLVCLEGEKRGVDFKVYGEKNTIGRGPENDIKIDFDMAISKGVNATIAYDRKNNKFYVAPGGASKNNMYVNESLLMVPVELKDYDILEIGQTKMIFRSLCNDQFNWDTANKTEENK